MPLNDLLFHAADFAFWGAGTVADNASTVFALKKNPSLYEQNFETVKKIENDGKLSAMIDDVKSQARWTVPFFAGLYGVDYLLGVQDNAVNFHHAMFYGTGSLKFMAAAHNVLLAYGKNDLARKVAYVPSQYIKCLEMFWDPVRDGAVKWYHSLIKA
jgi:hypothetical protein